MIPIKHPSKASTASILNTLPFFSASASNAITPTNNNEQESRLSYKKASVAAGGTASIHLSTTKKIPIRLGNRLVRVTSPPHRFEIKL
jgi:hypothetical protein